MVVHIFMTNNRKYICFLFETMAKKSLYLRADFIKRCHMFHPTFFQFAYSIPNSPILLTETIEL